jgi:hypothetical protein
MKKKSVEMMALEMACQEFGDCPLVGRADECPKCMTEGPELESCKDTVAAHFLSLAKKEMDKEKKS